jgi:N-acetylmuramoyl-L-alanine amidase
MKLNFKNIIFNLICFVFICFSAFSQKNKQVFTVILDAGHGGKDPGNSYHGFTEKEISLKTTLKVGSYLEQKKDIKIIYTRTKDVFVELANRPKIANKVNANLFVSIHCNSVKNFEPAGTETFVMGLSRSNMNLEVAKKENSVILLEDNYKETYEGFDPKKPESLLGITLVQEENLKSSIDLATKIQDNFTSNLNRKTRGVKQQPLWVLDAAYMPSVLIELGFLSNKEEGSFLNSDEGQTKMAKQIADAIIEYKKDFFGDSTINNSNQSSNDIVKVKTKKDNNKLEKKDTVSISTENKTKDSEAIVYKVQLCAGSNKLELKPSNFKGLKNISKEFNNNLYKYFYGETSNLEEAQKKQQEAKNKGYLSAFIIRIKKGKSIYLKD